MTKINLNRCRKEYARPRRFVGKTVTVNICLAPDDKAALSREAAELGYSFSLYINLILHGQEKSPLKAKTPTDRLFDALKKAEREKGEK